MSDQPDVPMIDPSRGWGGKLSDWFKKHWTTTIILAIIVFLIWGIYSNYSETDNELVNTTANIKNTLGTDTPITGDNPNIETVNTDTTNETVVVSQPTAEEKTIPAETIIEDKDNKVITVIAVKGEGITNLSRRALKQYLQNNSNSELTKEHKIFIEDYMRKNVSATKIKVGNSKAFSENLIQEAINASKKLTAKQLNNLQKYSAKVPNL